MRFWSVLCCAVSYVVAGPVFATPQAFDELAGQIRSGKRYALHLSEQRALFAELHALLPANDPVRQEEYQRLSCASRWQDDAAQGLTVVQAWVAASEQPDQQSQYLQCQTELYHLLGEAGKADESALAALKVARKGKDPYVLAQALLMTADLHSFRGEYALSLQQLFEASALFSALGYRYWQGYCIEYIATTYRRMGDYQQAIAYLEQAERDYVPSADQFRIAFLMHEKAYSLAELKRFAQARALFEASRVIYQQLKEPLWVQYTNVNLTWMLYETGHYQQALALGLQTDKQLQAASEGSAVNTTIYRALLKLYLGQTQHALGQPETALKSFADSEALMKLDHSARHLVLLHQARAAVYQQLGLYQQALEDVQQVLHLRTGLTQAAQQQQADLLRYQFDSERQQVQSEQLKRERNLSQQQVEALQQAQRWQYAALGTLVLCFGLLVWLLINQSKRNRRLHHLAMTDELTQVANRRRILQRAESLRLQAEHNHTALAVCLLDIDHFKQVNDRYGHDSGDWVLQQVAQSCQQLLRKDDGLGRTGGEEFLLLFPETELADAVAAADRLRLAVQALQFGMIDAELQVRVSLGLAMLLPGENLTSLISRADKALYQAKANGRNQVCVAE
ncbi:GGDEF domain-containing protein [Rheinheimera sp.]|uniref:tetratricopeptide repeat-containing diguanylate cyclase n=1 Tax=Rheinheimera sp. TaxID=1869214 RepID=UPI00307FBEA7